MDWSNGMWMPRRLRCCSGWLLFAGRTFPIENGRGGNLAAALVRVQENKLPTFSLDQNKAFVTAFILPMIQQLSERSVGLFHAQQPPTSATTERRIVYGKRPPPAFDSANRQLHRSEERRVGKECRL